jgi:hypothetical protein
MNRTVILIDDNKDWLKSLSFALSENFKTFQVLENFVDSLKKLLRELVFDNIVILLNANLKFKEKDIRSEYKGIKLLEDCIRLECRSLAPVVVTSFESEEEFISNPHNSIMRAFGHFYYQYPPKISELIELLIQKAKPIRNEGALNETIRRYCSLLGKIKVELHDIEHILLKEDINLLRNELSDEVTRLKLLIPVRYHKECSLPRLENKVSSLKSLEEKDGIKELIGKFKSEVNRLFQ